MLRSGPLTKSKILKLTCRSLSTDAKSFESIPGPTPLPFVGNSWRYMVGDLRKSDYKSFCRKMHEKYGDIFILKKLITLPHLVMLFSGEDIEKMFRNEEWSPVRIPLKCLTHYRTVVRKDVYGDLSDVVNLQGKHWMDIRSKVNPILMKPSSVLDHIDSFNNISDQFVDNMRYMSRLQQRLPDNFADELYKWSYETIVMVTFGKRLGCLDLNAKDEVLKKIESARTVLKLINVLDFTPTGKFHIALNTKVWRTFAKHQDDLTWSAIKYTKEVEDNMASNPKLRECIVGKLPQLPKPIKMGLINDLLTAGIDTTGSLAGVILYDLARNKRVQDKLRKELIEALPSANAPITSEVVQNLPYLKATIRESARMTPAATSTLRKTTKETVLSGYHIPRDTHIFVPNHYLCSLEHFYPKANEFLPERWLRSSENELWYKNGNPFISMPFGYGLRACLGKRIANLEMEILIAKIVRNFYLEWPYGEVSFSQGLVYSIKDPLKIHVKSVEQ